MEPPFKVSCPKGQEPIIIDYMSYKITIRMQNGVLIKIFKCNSERWFKLKETAFSYLAIEECINYAKSFISQYDNTFLLDKFNSHNNGKDSNSKG